jgi:hypothetical protein
MSRLVLLDPWRKHQNLVIRNRITGLVSLRLKLQTSMSHQRALTSIVLLYGVQVLFLLVYLFDTIQGSPLKV